MGKGLGRTLRRGGKNDGRQPIVTKYFSFKNLVLSVVDGAPGYGSVAAFRLPQGNLLVHGAVGYLNFTTTDEDITATFDGDVSIGSGSTSDATLSGAEINLVASTALGAATAKVSPTVRLPSATANNGVIHNNTDSDLIFYINLLIDDAAISGAADFLVNGSIKVSCTVLGDD